MKEQTPLEVLYTLVNAHSQRIQGYHKAIQDTDEDHLRTLFIEFQQTSHTIQQKLYKEIDLVGGNSEPLPNPPQYLSNVLAAFRMALAGSNRDDILSTCEDTEAQIDEIYKSIMTFSIYGCPVSLQSLIRNQHALITMDYSKVRSLKQMLKVAK